MRISVRCLGVRIYVWSSSNGESSAVRSCARVPWTLFVDVCRLLVGWVVLGRCVCVYVCLCVGLRMCDECACAWQRRWCRRRCKQRKGERTLQREDEVDDAIESGLVGIHTRASALHATLQVYSSRMFCFRVYPNENV